MEETLQILVTQQQQQIDILMMLLKNQNQDDADFLDYVHNKKNVFLSELSTDEFTSLMTEYTVNMEAGR